MAWTTPKTDWNSTSSDGHYTGDYFSYVDYNRIRGNLLELTSLAEQLYPTSWSHGMPSAKTVDDIGPTAGDFNNFEYRLHDINNQTVKASIGTRKSYSVNGIFVDDIELNRVENATVTLRNLLLDQAGGRLRLKFRLGLTGPFRD